jgi:hypothetical protein
MADGVEKRGLAVLKVFQDMHCRSNVNSELVIMKHMEELSNCAVRRKFSFTEVNDTRGYRERVIKMYQIHKKKETF